MILVKEEIIVGRECIEKKKRMGFRVQLEGPVFESWRDVISAEAPRKRQELIERKRHERRRNRRILHRVLNLLRVFSSF